MLNYHKFVIASEVFVARNRSFRSIEEGFLTPRTPFGMTGIFQFRVVGGTGEMR